MVIKQETLTRQPTITAGIIASAISLYPHLDPSLLVVHCPCFTIIFILIGSSKLKLQLNLNFTFIFSNDLWYFCTSYFANAHSRRRFFINNFITFVTRYCKKEQNVCCTSRIFHYLLFHWFGKVQLTGSFANYDDVMTPGEGFINVLHHARKFLRMV